MFGKREKKARPGKYFENYSKTTANNYGTEQSHTVYSTETGIQNCKLCNMPVKSIHTALRYRDTDGLVHFDCALRELIREYKNKLGRNLKIYYVGGGDFAIVREILDKRGFLKTFEIIERIEYEKNK